MLLYSPPDNEVGMEMMGTVGAFMSVVFVGESKGSVANSSNVVALLAIAYYCQLAPSPICPNNRLRTRDMIFAASVKLPAPRVMIKSA